MDTPREVMNLRRLVRIALHEAAHVVVARYFGLRAFGVVTWEMSDGKEVIGGTAYHQPTTAFRSACIGWAGLVGEELWSWDCEDFGEEYLKEIFEDFFPSRLSVLDRAAVDAHPQKWRAAKLASRVLLQHREAWRYEALLILVDRSQP